MNDSNERFIVDANTLITPYRTFYSFDLAPQFWTFLSHEILRGNIIVLDSVYDEITRSTDDLTNWMKSIDGLQTLNHGRDRDIIANYARILNYIQNCGLYKPIALTNWADERIADPWIIAAAMKNNYTVITFEARNGNLSSKQPSKNANIPDVCEAFGVKYGNLYSMLRALSFHLGGAE